jgi:hypothetical protein
VASLVPSPHSHDQGFDDLASRAATLERTLAERAAAVDRVKAEHAAFAARYREAVGRLHEQLEELDLAIAEAELGEISKRLDEQGASAGTSLPKAEPETAPRYTSDAVRRLFRDVAKAIHPDLADDESARDRRHRLMIEANRAYAIGDEERLRRILEAWENSPEAVVGDDPAAARERLLRRIAQLEADVASCDLELSALRATPLGKLKALVDEAAKRGTDLVADTVRRLKRDLLAAQNRLAAMRSHPQPPAR